MRFIDILTGAALLAAPAISAQVATFEDLGLPLDSVWYHAADFNPKDATVPATFTSGDYTFNNLYTPEWGSWSFWSYSSKTSNKFELFATDQWNSCVGGGYQSPTFGVIYADTYNGANTITPATPRVIPGTMVTNSAYDVSAFLNGDGMSPAFAKGDWYKATATGFHADSTTSTVEIALADYTSDTPNYLKTWQWVDLSPLGEVTRVEFSFASTKNNDWGMTTPAYMCIDNFGSEKPESSITALSADNAAVHYFNLQGQPVTAPVPGHIYIRRQGAKASKIIF